MALRRSIATQLLQLHETTGCEVPPQVLEQSRQSTQAMRQAQKQIKLNDAVIRVYTPLWNGKVESGC